jgi:aspartate aminotransferase-like enzyme
MARSPLPQRFEPTRRKETQMSKNASRMVGRHFLQIPGPTPIPDRILRAMDTAIIDHRGPEFAALAKRGSKASNHLQDRNR